MGFDKSTNVSLLCCRCLRALSPIALEQVKPIAQGFGDVFCKACAQSHHDTFSNMFDQDLGLEIEEGIDEIDNPTQNVVLNYSFTKQAAKYFLQFRSAFQRFFVTEEECA